MNNPSEEAPMWGMSLTILIMGILFLNTDISYTVTIKSFSFNLPLTDIIGICLLVFFGGSMLQSIKDFFPEKENKKSMDIISVGLVIGLILLILYSLFKDIKTVNLFLIALSSIPLFAITSSSIEIIGRVINAKGEEEGKEYKETLIKVSGLLVTVISLLVMIL
ncbi:hypothetical protein [Halobacillus aidingensis]|uniref:Uncharacterized protein n=1 Tax=Halobacillus aidingensis TaxID=240303 RepID=A0A1H0G1A1_HALAD|nr:hypothetical protein [Halobacillus aidingensis]SDO00621.1 hypothetical protein SAMN05421677_102187 [Halobacillus aidingensis]